MAQKKAYDYSLHLAKAGVSRREFLTTTGRVRADYASSEIGLPDPGFGDWSELIIFHTDGGEPEWAPEMHEHFNFGTLSKSTYSAIVLFEVQGRLFALSFGHGHVYVDERQRVNDFGLRVAINTLDENKMQTFGRNNILSAIKDESYSPLGSNILEFRIDDAFEVFKKLTGKTNISHIKSISGSKSLQIKCETPPERIDELCSELLTQYCSDAYQKTSFRAIDDLMPVTDISLVDALDELAFESVRDSKDDFELCLPEINFGQLGRVRVAHTGHSGIHHDISLEKYVDLISLRPEPMEQKDLTDDSIVLLDDNDDIAGQWRVRNCLLGSLVHNDRRYVINEGEWFSPSEQEYNTANTYFQRHLRPADPNLKNWSLWKPLNGPVEKIRYQHENEYLEEIASEGKYILFDRDFFPSSAGGQNQLELCDLFDPVGRRFIHVKQNSRRSQMITYLLEQGRRAARELKLDDALWRAFFERLVEKSGNVEHARLSERPLSDFTFEFRIADFPVRNSQDYNIPFFSRLALKSKGREIEVYGFKLGIGFIHKARP